MAANYTMGATTVYGAYWTEKQDVMPTNVVKLDAVGMMIGAKHTIGAVSYAVSYSTRDDKSTVDMTTSYANSDRKSLGLGADYALSKRTAVWVRYVKQDPNSNRSGTSAIASTPTSFNETKTTAVGIRHTF